MTAITVKPIPTFRIKRALRLDPEVPRISKDALATLAAATSIFLEHVSAHLHKHISAGSSYPVRVAHLVNLVYDARYPKLHFLQDAQDLLHEDAANMKPFDDAAAEPQNIKATGSKGNAKGISSIANYFGV